MSPQYLSGSAQLGASLDGMRELHLRAVVMARPGEQPAPVGESGREPRRLPRGLGKPALRPRRVAAALLDQPAHPDAGVAIERSPGDQRRRFVDAAEPKQRLSLKRPVGRRCARPIISSRTSSPAARVRCAVRNASSAVASAGRETAFQFAHQSRLAAVSCRRFLRRQRPSAAARTPDAGRQSWRRSPA